MVTDPPLRYRITRLPEGWRRYQAEIYIRVPDHRSSRWGSGFRETVVDIRLSWTAAGAERWAQEYIKRVRVYAERELIVDRGEGEW